MELASLSEVYATHSDLRAGVEEAVERATAAAAPRLAAVGGGAMFLHGHSVRGGGESVRARARCAVCA